MTRSTFWLFSVLAVIMALTRFHHFGSAFSLPDVSLAVFFLAGFSFLKARFFWVFLAEAALIDYLAISQFEVSDYCVSAAYFWLLPTYAVMWLGGRLALAFQNLNLADSLKVFALAGLAVTIAFGISNGSFYWFSGKFENLTWGQYWEKTGHYYTAYASSTLLYCLLGMATVKLRRWASGQTRAVME